MVIRMTGYGSWSACWIESTVTVLDSPGCFWLSIDFFFDNISLFIILILCNEVRAHLALFV